MTYEHEVIERAELEMVALETQVRSLKNALERITECVESRDGGEGVQVIAGAGFHFWAAVREAKAITHSHLVQPDELPPKPNPWPGLFACSQCGRPWDDPIHDGSDQTSGQRSE